MNKYVAIGGDPSFGCDGAELKINGEGPTIGLLQSCDTSNNNDKWEGRDSNGNVARVVIYNKNGDLNATFHLENGAPLPQQGDTLTVGGDTGLIETVKIAWKNDSGTQVDISGHWNDHVDTSIVTVVAETSQPT